MYNGITVTAIVWKEGDVFVADCPQLEIASQGETEDEALSNLQEAIELYLEDYPKFTFPVMESVKAVPLEIKHAT